MGHRTSPGCGNLQHCILYLFLELFLTALYFRVAYRPTFRACDPFMQVPYVTECPLEGYGNIRPFHEWGTCCECWAVIFHVELLYIS